MFYSPTTGGFYCPGIHGEAIPSDRVEISVELHGQLMQQMSEGKRIVPGTDGMPVTIEQALLSDAGRAEMERKWRNHELASLIWLRDRHRDQLEIGVEATLTTERFNQVLLFMQALRDWPQSDAFPDLLARPEMPAFLSQMRVEQ